MAGYLPIIISAVLIVAILLWWLLALDGVKKTDSASKDTVSPPAAVPAPPVAPVAKVAVPPKLMDDLAPASKTAKATAQAPLKAAATKKAPAPKAAAPKKAIPAAKVAKPAKPKAEAVPLEVAPKSKAPKPAAKAVPDNLELIKGLGPKVNNMLKDLGITSFGQIASLSSADVAELDSKLGAFAGRMTRDNWIDQAQLLAAGDVAGFEQKYGALGAGAKV